MTESAKSYVIFSLAKRVQHLLFILGFTLSFLTGAALRDGGGLLGSSMVMAFGSVNRLYWWHALFGLAAAVFLLGHILYLVMRGYVEDISFRLFPLKFGPRDLGAMVSEAGGIVTGRRTENVRYPPSRRLTYWLFLSGALVISLTGMAIYFWDWLDIGLLSVSLDLIAALHAGTSFLFLVLAIWHIYAVAGGGSRLFALKLAVTGGITEDRLKEYYPVEYRNIREAEARIREEWRKADGTALEEEERSRERRVMEETLARGNSLAREGAHLEAAEEYRKALDIFPGYSQAQYNLALVLEKAARRGEALEAYQRFLEIDPFHSLAARVREGIRRLEG
jgi:tetratricopeptide (TPR) repeat protein